MNTFIISVLSITLVVLLGFTAGKLRIINDKYDGGFSIYILNFSLPLLLFNTVSNANLSQLLDPKMNITFIIGLLGMFILTFLVHKLIFKRNLQESAQTAFLCSYPNTAFLGIPLMLAIVGTQAMIPIVVSNIIVGVLIIPLTLILIEIGLVGINHISYRKVMLKIFKTPLITLSFTGLIFAILQIKLPQAIQHSFELVGSSTPGISLFTLGLIISRFKITPTKIAWLNVFFKNILHPLLIILIVKIVGLNGIIAKELILLCAMPPALSSTFFSVLFNINPPENITSTVLSTALSFFTISLFMYALHL